MQEEFSIVYLDTVDDPVWKAVGGGLQKFNNQQAGDHNLKHLCFLIYAPDQEILGGLIGETYWDWLNINLLWLKDDLRGRGYGHRLLTMAEEEGRKRGAKNVYLFFRCKKQTVFCT